MKVSYLKNSDALSQLSVWILLQLFASDHRARYSEGQRAVDVTSMSEPEKEDDDDDSAGKSDSRRRSRFLSWRASHRQIRYDTRLSRCRSSLAGDDCEEAKRGVTV